MNKPIPAPSKILSKKWRDLNMESHYRRLRGARSLVDNQLKQRSLLRSSHSRKQRMQEDRQQEIVRDNSQLVKKMTNIFSTKSSLRALITTPQRSRTWFARKQHLEAVTHENLAMLGRLMNTKSEYDVKKLENERKFHERMLKHLCEYPYMLGQSCSNHSIRDMRESSHHSMSAKTLSRRKPLQPLEHTRSNQLLHSGTKQLGLSTFVIAVVSSGKKLKMIAQDTTKGESFTLRISRSEASHLMQTSDDYEKLLDALELADGELTLVNLKPKLRKVPSGHKDSGQASSKLAHSLNETTSKRKETRYLIGMPPRPLKVDIKQKAPKKLRKTKKVVDSLYSESTTKGVQAYELPEDYEEPVKPSEAPNVIKEISVVSYEDSICSDVESIPLRSSSDSFSKA